MRQNQTPQVAQPVLWEDMLDRNSQSNTPAAQPDTHAAVVQRQEQREKRVNSYMTHELRAPLTSIRSAIGLLKESLEGRLSERESQTLLMALRNADRLNGLIDDIMDYSKIRSNKLSLVRKAVYPHEMMHEAVESLRSWAVAKGVRLVLVDSVDPLPRVYADRQRTVQVLINLIANAIKYTPAGGRIQVQASMGRYQHTGNVQFKVKDTGPGIAHSDLERIFHCFEQAANAEHPQKTSSGTGLGLTLAKSMVELQKGRIWAESWQGLGASFLFTLPIMAWDNSQPVATYPKPVQFHGILVKVYRRLNAIVAALFT